MREYTRTDCELRVPVSTVYHPENKKEPMNPKFYIDGTTFSGHPSRTTLGNTLRTLMYAWTYAAMAGIEIEPLAAGDDCVVFCERIDA
jgi:hypothetical protein